MTVPTPLRDLARTLVAGRDPARPPGPAPTRHLALRAAFPVLVAALSVGLALGALANITDGKELRALPQLLELPLAILSSVPLLLLLRYRSMDALRICWLVALISGLYAPDYDQPWPANPPAVVVFLVVLLVVGYRREPTVLGWVWAISSLLIWWFCSTGVLPGSILLVTVMLMIGHVAGRWSRSKRRLTTALAAEQERGAVLTERARIARELHDVVAHHMSLIAVRAETAPYRLPGLPEPAAKEFTEISQASREALTEMRRLLGVLRSEGERPAVEPQPDLAELPALVDAARAAGTPVAVEFAGDLRDLPPAEQLSAYRIVQESLSNAARHATGAQVRIEMNRTARELVLSVSNAAGAAGSPEGGGGGAGHGLRGMRERAVALGGQLSAYPTEGGGFEVRASLPVALPEGEE